MLPNVVDLTQELIRIQSVSAMSNAPVSDFLHEDLEAIG